VRRRWTEAGGFARRGSYRLVGVPAGKPINQGVSTRMGDTD
jgi:hypothetical protein